MLVCFQTLSATEKKKFEDQAKVDKDRYDREMKNYIPPKDMGKKGRKKKDPNAPKRPPYVQSSNYSQTYRQNTHTGCNHHFNLGTLSSLVPGQRSLCSAQSTGRR